MPTSGSSDFNRTRDQIIEAALRKTGELGRGDTLSAEQNAEAAEALNLIVKNLQAGPDGVRLWKIEEKVATISASSEVTGSDSNIYTAIRNFTSVISTDKPITGNKWSYFWVKDGDTGGVYANGTAYTSSMQMVLDDEDIGIHKAFLRNTEGNDTELTVIPIDDYSMISDKGVIGTPTKIYLEKYLDSSGVVKFRGWLYPRPTDTTDIIIYQAVIKLEDFDASGNNPDFPVSWIRPLIYLLASDMADEIGLALNERMYLRNVAGDLLKTAKLGDISPNNDVQFKVRRS
jgi:hypothetical protein